MIEMTFLFFIIFHARQLGCLARVHYAPVRAHTVARQEQPSESIMAGKLAALINRPADNALASYSNLWLKTTTCAFLLDVF